MSLMTLQVSRLRTCRIQMMWGRLATSSRFLASLLLRLAKSELPAHRNSPMYFALLAALCQAAVPTPQSHLGFTPGDDYKLPAYQDIRPFFQKWPHPPDPVLLPQSGTTAMGQPMDIPYISAPHNPKTHAH